jgi:hypothetical protein
MKKIIARIKEIQNSFPSPLSTATPTGRMRIVMRTNKSWFAVFVD